MSRLNLSQDTVLPPFLNDTRSRQVSINRTNRQVKIQSDHHNASFSGNPNYINMMQLPRIGTSQAAVLPLKLFDNKNPLFYSTEHLKKCLLAALKKLNFSQNISHIERDTLKNAFVQMGIFINRLQLEEGYEYSITELHGDHGDQEHDRGYNSNRHKKKLKANMSMDNKDKPVKVKFLVDKFIKWLKHNMHKMRNLRIGEIKEVDNRPATKPANQPKEGETDEKLPGADQRKNILAKIARDKHYWDLRTRIDQEEVFRRRNVVPHILEMGFDDHTYLLNPESMIARVKTQFRLEESDKKECVWDINKLKEMNREIKDKVEPVVMDANQEKLGMFKAGNIMGTIVDSYKKKLKEDEVNAKRYAAMAKARIKQRKLEKEFRTNLEMSAILQEQETAIEAARLYELMCNDRGTRELKSFKRTLNNSQERRVQYLLKENF